MSIRTLIEINHDFTHRLDDGLIPALQRYLASASREHAEDLDRYGIRVIGMRHHSGRFYIEGEPDGFPAKTFPAKNGQRVAP